MPITSSPPTPAVTKYHSFKTIAEALAEGGSVYPESSFTFQDTRGGERCFNFVELEAETARYAAALQRHQVSVGDRVGLIIADPEQFVMSFFAAIRVGLVPTPLYPPLSLASLDPYVKQTCEVLSDSGATLLVVSDQMMKLLGVLIDRVPTLKHVISADTLRAPVQGEVKYPTITEDDLAFLQYTSGSTSNPKGVMVTHRSLVANCEAILQSGLKLKPGDGAVSWLPLYHDMGLIGFVITPLLHGLKTTLIPTLRFIKRPSVWFETIHKARAHVTFAPNFALALITKRARPEQLERWDLSTLRSVGCGAEPIQVETIRAFTELFSTRCGLPENAVTPAYGMAEATLAMTLKPLHEPPKILTCEAEPFLDSGRVVERASHLSGDPASEAASQPSDEVLKWVSCGPPLPGHELAVVNAEGDRLPDGQEGELTFRGPSVTRGYFDRPEATAQAYRDGWLHTGDLGFIKDEQVYITGRLKDLIIINGRNVHPQTIEWSVAEVEGVRKGNIVALSVPNDQSEQLVIALETRVEPGEARDALIQRVREVVQQDHALAVSEVVCLSAGGLPKTSSGKLQRRKTRALYLEGELTQRASRLATSRGARWTLLKYLAASLWARLKPRRR